MGKQWTFVLKLSLQAANRTVTGGFSKYRQDEYQETQCTYGSTKRRRAAQELAGVRRRATARETRSSSPPPLRFSRAIYSARIPVGPRRSVKVKSLLGRPGDARIG